MPNGMRLSRKDQERVVTERVIFARMTPENKVQVVQTLENAGVRTAMVGDGANDAAAIRAATVGIGVVAHGSDPAHMVADVVLVDGRIDALLEAIEEGRQLWRRVQAAVQVLLGGNAGEVLFAVIGSAITGVSPLNTRQLLLVNTMTDALPAAALAVSKPRGTTDPKLRGVDQPALWNAVVIRGVTTAAATTAAWAMASFTGVPGLNGLPGVSCAARVEQTARLDRGAWVHRAAARVHRCSGRADRGRIGPNTCWSPKPRWCYSPRRAHSSAWGCLISIPGVSQLLGCTPLDPLGWAEGLGAAAAATVAVGVLSRMFDDRRPTRTSCAGSAAEFRPATRMTRMRRLIGLHNLHDAHPPQQRIQFQ